MIGYRKYGRSEKDMEIMDEIVIRYGKYGRGENRLVITYGKYGRKES